MFMRKQGDEGYSFETPIRIGDIDGIGEAIVYPFKAYMSPTPFFLVNWIWILITLPIRIFVSFLIAIVCIAILVSIACLVFAAIIGCIWLLIYLLHLLLSAIH